MADELGDRERDVLRAVVREYIGSGDPVGSSHLARKAEFDVSAATMRNVMADLEALGFIEKPHTSAGRIPTEKGYRFYVDTLVKAKDPAPKDRELIEQNLAAAASTLEERFQEASKLLHFITRHAGVVVTPRPAAAVFHRIEFVTLREGRVLAILVGQNGEVQNKLLQLDFAFSAEEAVRASNYLSELLKDAPIEALHARLARELVQERAQYDLQAKALKLGMAATDVDVKERVLIEGANSFLDAPEFADVERMKAVLRALEEKNTLLRLLERVQQAREMRIFIGAESEFSSAGDVSVIASPYGTREKVLGTVGVIGPTRMNYQRVIPLVNFTAQVLSRELDPNERK